MNLITIELIDVFFCHKVLPFDDPFDNFFDRNNNEFYEVEADAFLSLNTDDDILIYPNPIFTGNNLIVRLNQGLEVNNLIISLYNIQGDFLNKFYVGDINPTLDNFNEFSLSIFNQYDSSGIYILSFDMDGKTQTKKIIYLK